MRKGQRFKNFNFNWEASIKIPFGWLQDKKEKVQSTKLSSYNDIDDLGVGEYRIQNRSYRYIRSMMVPSVFPLVMLCCQNCNFGRDHPQCHDGLFQGFSPIDLILDPQRSIATICPLLLYPPCFLNRRIAKHKVRRFVDKNLTLSQIFWEKWKVTNTYSASKCQIFHAYYLINKQTNLPFAYFVNKDNWGLERL